MIDELKDLIKLLGEIPEMALWVLAGFAIYKTFVFSSVTGALYYGFRFLTEKVHDALIRPTVTAWEFGVDGTTCIDDAKRAVDAALRDALFEVKTTSGYVHLSDAAPIIRALRSVKKDKDEG